MSISRDQPHNACSKNRSYTANAEINLLSPTAFLDNAFHVVPSAIAAGSALDHVATDLASPAGHASPGCPTFRDLGRAAGLRRGGRALLGGRKTCRVLLFRILCRCCRRARRQVLGLRLGRAGRRRSGSSSNIDFGLGARQGNCLDFCSHCCVLSKNATRVIGSCSRPIICASDEVKAPNRGIEFQAVR